MREIGSMLRGMEDRLINMAGNAVEEVVRNTERLAREHVPVETGRLRDSIIAESRGLSGSVRAEAEYAAAVELGTYRMPPRPFLVPAAKAAVAALKGR